MRLLVCGSRDWTATEDIAYHLALIFGKETDRLVIHGNCGDLLAKPPRGADKIAGWLAAGVGASVDVCAVDQRLDGPWPAAGPRRNTRMLERGKPDQGLAFGPLWWRDWRWRPTGTGDMVSKMLRAKVPVRWVAGPGAPAVDLVEMPRP